MRFLWLDVETTGLDPNHDLLLEVAAWPSRSSDPFDLAPDGLRKWVIHHDAAALAEHLSPVTWRMHGKSGLLADVIESKTKLSDVIAGLHGMLGLMVGPVSLAGNSVHFDRDFLRSWCPGVAASLSHRLLDVSAILLAQRHALGHKIPKTEPAHRADDDVIQSIKIFSDCMERTGIDGDHLRRNYCVLDAYRKNVPADKEGAK